MVSPEGEPINRARIVKSRLISERIFTFRKRRLSGAREFQQWRNTMIVCCAQGCDVTSAQFANIRQAAAAPTKTLAAKAFDQKIGRQASVTAISIGKRVCCDQAMMEPDRNLVRRKCSCSVQ